MDPFTATASIASLAEIAIRTITSLVRYGYAKDTKNAFSEKKSLSEEAQSLSMVLERLKSRAGAANHDKWLSDHGDVVRQFEVAYDDLAQCIKVDPATGRRKEGNRFQAIRTVSTWSFTKFEINSLLERIGDRSITQIHCLRTTSLFSSNASIKNSENP
ncbi:hypothetical protein GJ744_004384 [Endocarpon pusillum]|uniref:Fungal N-terminal domain-containing protein n=1 Tax=Endocarpon pusillum TaxID=364733 RepID=A0A8H7E885_9EURO|nr:hypothetical protein GJ744_004384 [Endocarpon pusillum]